LGDIKTRCPKCAKRYLVDELEVGNLIECPRCQETFRIAPIEQLDAVLKTPAVAGAAQLAVGNDLIRTPAGEIVFPDLGLTLIPVPPGAFLRGTDQGEPDEGPVHRVQITQGFAMGKVPVTQAEYARVMGDAPCRFRGERLPADSVTWAEAAEFCRRLTAMQISAGRIHPNSFFRLPTEAEWEYCCRGGGRIPPGTGSTPAAGGNGGVAFQADFCYGSDPVQLAEYAWFAGNSGDTPHPVGEKKPNTFGLHDMHGNIGEWCVDWFSPYPTKDVTDPVGPPKGERRVRRGGSWASVPQTCRCAHRLGVQPACRSELLGFRVVLALMQQSR
jgi:formylglycine-generating enzyme required for sulfatase activity